MLADSQIDIGSGLFEEELHLPNEARHYLFEFVTSQLIHWKNDPNRPHDTSETKLTSGLCSYLNTAKRSDETWNRVSFQVEESDEAKGNRNIDLAAKPCGSVITIEGKKHTLYDMLFPIECKLLPVPDGKVSPEEKERDEREYAISRTSSTGGIHRFKEGHHGSTHNFGGMIGYIQDKDGGHWLDKVNGWIGDLAKNDDPIWTEGDLLRISKQNKSGEITSLQSLHKRRTVSDDIALHHAWVLMN